MQVTQTQSEGLKRGFTVTVPAGDLEARRAARLAELGRTINLPGFRPGKVPASLVKQRYGAALNGEILEQVDAELLALGRVVDVDALRDDLGLLDDVGRRLNRVA